MFSILICHFHICLMFHGRRNDILHTFVFSISLSSVSYRVHHESLISVPYKIITLFFNYYYFFLLYNIVLVLPYINMNLPQVYTCSPS